MRLLGKCPKCGVEDLIVVEHETGKLKRVAHCEGCQQYWDDWLTLNFEQNRRGNKLIPVCIEHWGRSVQLYWPQFSEIAWARLVATILNTALMVRFKLEVCLSTEGGVKGFYRKESIELRNFYDQIGLYDEYQIKSSIGAVEILNWYEVLLKILVEDELIVGDEDYDRGAILKLSGEPENEAKAKTLLWLALCKKTGSKGFADKVFERLGIEQSNPFSGRHIAGLSDEDIVELFVPPPM